MCNLNGGRTKQNKKHNKAYSVERGYDPSRWGEGGMKEERASYMQEVIQMKFPRNQQRKIKQKNEVMDVSPPEEEEKGGEGGT